MKNLWTSISAAAEDSQSRRKNLRDLAQEIIDEEPDQLGDNLVIAYLRELADENIAGMDADTRRKYMGYLDAARRDPDSVADTACDMQAGTLDITTAALEMIAKFQRSNEWRHYCRMIPDASERIETLLIKHGGVLDVMHTLDLNLNLKMAAPFADDVISEWSANHDGDAPQFTVFVYDMLSRCVEMAFETGRPESVQAIAARRLLMPNTIVANQIGELLPDANNARTKRNEYIQRNVGRSKKHPCYVKLSAAYDADNLKFIGGVMTEFDKAVNNAFASLCDAGNTFITGEMIYRAMNGITETQKVEADIVKDIEASIEKQRGIKLIIDASEQIEKFKITDGAGGRPHLYYDDYLISAARVVAEVNGIRKYGYRPHTVPILTQYSRNVKRIVTVPAEWLDIKKVTKGGTVSVVSEKNSRQRTLIKHYLAHRIKVMQEDEEKALADRRHKRQQGRRILFSSVYEASEIRTDDKYAVKRARDFVFCVLDYYKAADIISAYKTDGGSESHKPYTYIDIVL